MKYSLNFFASLFLIMKFHWIKATTLNQTHPSYIPVCPGDNVTFTCTVTTGAISWSLNSNGAVESTRVFLAVVNDNGDIQLLAPFTLTLVNKTGSTLVSTATVTGVTYSLNDTSIYCSNDGSTNFNDATLTVTDTTLPPIGLSVTALNDSSVNLTWSPPSLDSTCITGYMIISRDDGIPVVMTTTSTNTLVLSHGLSYGNTYNFTVAAVDKTNTTGSYSQHVIINLSVPNVVRNLNYTSSPGDGTITVYWDSPVNNYHPDIIRYIIRYTNMTDDTSRDVTNYTLRGVSGGSSYSISVLAVNIIGEGTNDTIYVSLVYVSPSPSWDTTDVSLSTIDSTPRTSALSIVSSSTTTCTPSTITVIITTSSNFMSAFHTSALPCTTVIQQSDEFSTISVLAIIGVPITAVLSAVVTSIVSSLVTYYCCWLKSKGRSDSYSPPAGQHHDTIPPGDDGIVLPTGERKGLELKDNMAYGQVTAGKPPVLPVYETVNI